MIRVAGRCYVQENGLWCGEIPAFSILIKNSNFGDLWLSLDLEIRALCPSFDFSFHTLTSAHTFLVEVRGDVNEVTAFILRRSRRRAGLSALDAAIQLGSRHPNSILAYENGSRVPSIGKLDALLRNYGKRLCLIVEDAE